MANTRQLATIDEEALVPKRVKKGRVQKILKNIQFSASYLTAFQAALKDVDEKTLPTFLQWTYAERLIEHFDFTALAAYAITSKKAYLNIHKHPKSLTLFAGLAEKKITQATTLNNQTHHRAQGVLNITEENNHYWCIDGTKSSVYFIIWTPVILLAILLHISIASAIILTCKKLFSEDSFNEYKTYILLCGIISPAFATIPSAYAMLTNALNRCAAKYHNNAEENTELLNQLNDTVKNNDLPTTQKTLMEAGLLLFKPSQETTNAVADEETPLLRR